MSRVEQLAEGITLHLGDCREILPTLGKVDAVITDPPYGNGTQYNGDLDSEYKIRRFIDGVLPWCLKNAKRTLITSGNSNQYLYPRPDWTLAWVVPAGAGSNAWGFTCWQPILVYGNDPYLAAGKGCRPDIFVHTETAEANGHPCPKPIGFMKKLVERGSLVGDLICDPFMGSGTTGVAAMTLGRQFVGIEIEPKYFDIACRRISEATKQTDMFVDVPSVKQGIMI